MITFAKGAAAKMAKYINIKVDIFEFDQLLNPQQQYEIYFIKSDFLLYIFSPFIHSQQSPLYLVVHPLSI